MTYPGKRHLENESTSRLIKSSDRFEHGLCPSECTPDVPLQTSLVDHIALKQKINLLCNGIIMPVKIATFP